MGTKLIRDKIKDDPNLSEEAKRYIRKVTDDEYFGLLVGKLHEEMGELFAAAGTESNSDEAVLEELVDVYTVLISIIKLNVPWETFEAAFIKKLEEKGGFDEGFAWDRHHYVGE